MGAFLIFSVGFLCECPVLSIWAFYLLCESPSVDILSRLSLFSQPLSSLLSCPKSVCFLMTAFHHTKSVYTEWLWSSEHWPSREGTLRNPCIWAWCGQHFRNGRSGCWHYLFHLVGLVGSRKWPRKSKGLQECLPIKNISSVHSAS